MSTPVTPGWETVGLGLLGVIALIVGVVFRFGPPDASRAVYDRYRRYRNPNLPLYVRNMVLVSLPLGVVGLLMVAAIVFLAAGGWGIITGAVLTVLFIVGFVVVVVLAHAPPAWLKPDWLREEERTGQRRRLS